MNLRSWILSIAIAIQFFYITGNSIAQEKMDEEAMKSYMELSKPGEEHKLLESLAGEWNMELKLWPEPGKEPVMFKGTGTHEMILGGRFLQSSSTSGEGDMKTESLSIFGFDRRHKKFTLVGFDTWGTYYVTAAGLYDEKTKTITMYGEDEDPMAGTQKYDMILHLVNPKKFIWEIIFKDFRTPEEEPFKMLEITSTKK